MNDCLITQWSYIEVITTLWLTPIPELLRTNEQGMIYSTQKSPQDYGHPNEWYPCQHLLRHFDQWSQLWRVCLNWHLQGIFCQCPLWQQYMNELRSFPFRNSSLRKMPKWSRGSEIVSPCGYQIPPTMSPTTFTTGSDWRTLTRPWKAMDTQCQKKYHDSWKKLLDEHLQAGQIWPSSSEYASPAFCVPKYRDGVPDLTIPPCWVNDYRELNNNTIRDNFPLPRVDDILADCARGKIFGKMDMTNSFFQTWVHPDDIHLTAIWTPWGLYELVVMPMGKCNAPNAAWQMPYETSLERSATFT